MPFWDSCADFSRGRPRLVLLALVGILCQLVVVDHQSDAGPYGGGSKMIASPFRYLLLILAFAFVLDVIVADSMSQTMDEGDHLEYGRRILRGQPDRSGPYMDIKTPITALNAFPRAIGVRFDSRSFPRIRKFFSSLTLARIPSILAGLALIGFIYQIAYELYGRVAALSAALLAALSPNLIAHGTLATTDGYFALGVISALYFFRRYLLQPTLANACVSGLALALAQITKPLVVYLYPIEGIFLIAAATVGRRWIKITGKDLAISSAVTAACSICVLNVAYLFDRTFAPLSSYHFETSAFRSLQKPWFMDKVRVPFPYPVLQGLDMAQRHDETGVTYGNVYLQGALRSVNGPGSHGFRDYYLVVWLVKEPIPLQILFIWGLIQICRRRRNGGFLFSECLLLVSSGVLVLWLSLFSKAQIGIRHILPALAIEVIIGAATFSEWASFSRSQKTALALLLVWLAASAFSYYPNMIPYMNEWVPDRKLSYQILADSNLDWGQNLGLVRNFLKNNPDVVLNPDLPVSGRILVSANRLVGVVPKDKGPLLWALRYRPVGHVGYAHLLFEIPPKDLAVRSR